jgi:cell division protein FtsI (penicillin-binding protein 3)
MKGRVEAGIEHAPEWMAPLPPNPRRGDTTRPRLRLVIGAFALIYLVIATRLVLLGLGDPTSANRGSAADAVAAARPDIVDRNGEVLATDIKTASLYAEPRKVLDPDEAAEAIAGVMPDLGVRTLREKLSGNAGFVWLKREIDPEQREAIHRLGIPGIGFLTENQRFYPGGATSSHILGAVNVDNQGIAGIEKYLDDDWLSDLHASGFAKTPDLQPVRLSIDLRVQHILRDELASAMQRYQAVAATGIILDVHTGEVLAMSSLPDYDPNRPAEALQPDRLNRMTAGVFEMGSVFKTFTVAMALDSGKVTMTDSFDARSAIRSGRFTINDFHGKHRVLSLPEVFIYSSNIGAARMALAAGIDEQRNFLRRVGMMDRVKTQLPETARPLVPGKWAELTAMTVAFGHGISVTPMHTAMATAALMNGGYLIPPTFLPRSREEAERLAVQVVHPRTSDEMRQLFRTNVVRGSGRRAEVPGYMVGGKTGTAEKVEKGRYSRSKRFNSFLAAFPMDSPQYVVLVVIDEPQPEKPGISATASLNTAPTVAAIIRRSAPMLGVAARDPGQDTALLASY